MKIRQPIRIRTTSLPVSVAYFTGEVNPSLAKPPLKFSDGLAKRGWTFLLKEATGFGFINQLIS